MGGKSGPSCSFITRSHLRQYYFAFMRVLLEDGMLEEASWGQRSLHFNDTVKLAFVRAVPLCF